MNTASQPFCGKSSGGNVCCTNNRNEQNSNLVQDFQRPQYGVQVASAQPSKTQTQMKEGRHKTPNNAERVACV